MKTALVAAALASGLFLAGCGSTSASSDESTSPTPTPASQAPVESPSESPTDAADGAFGPVGFDGIEIGMSLDELKATGNADFPDGEGDGQSCVWFSYANLPVDNDNAEMALYDGMIGPKGVELIDAREGMKTPEGIGAGSTKAEALAAYPNAKFRSDYGNYRAHVAGQPKGVAYFFAIRNGKVSGINVSVDTPECYN
jgi:hypothetical protein